MIINSIGLKNFKSYGNNMQTVTFKNGGELILLSGDNEAGKSSLIESIDFTLYGVVRGKKTKKIALTKLPNRLNKNLETEIKFINEENDNIIIRKKLEPTSIEIYKNGKPFLTEFKSMTVEQREKFIGLEYNTYKSLISLNLSDFANFINLDTETKRKLLNKLFNISEIDDYFSICKEILKNTYKEKERIETFLLSNQSTIDTYNENIQNIKSQTISVNKEEIKNEILSYRDIYTNLKQEITDLNTSNFQLLNEIKKKREILEGKKNRIIQESFILKEITKKIDVFKTGICPVCDSELDTEDKKHKLIELEEEELKQTNDINSIKGEYTESVNEIQSISSERTIISNNINQKNYEYNEIDYKLKDLKKQYNTEDIDSVSLLEIKKNITKLEHDNIELNKKLENSKKKITRYEKTSEYLSEKGVRKNIIGSIIDPINKNLEFFLKEIQSNYIVKLNDQFDATIKDRFEEIDSETLSIGGGRKINIAIALSYIKTILDLNKRINILFLDEVFSSISPSNINIMLRVLKDFARTNNINIVIVHQIVFDENMFDRIIHVEKKYFSTITDTYTIKKDEV
jgi:DNA repair exonuclease SbcCD ATPase subunit